MIYTPSPVYTPGTAGAPVTGTWATSSLVVDSNDALWVCTAGGTPGTWAQVSGGGGGGGTATVPEGGTGLASLTAYAVITGGTTSTNAVQQIAALGGAGNPLVSGGAGAVPAFTKATVPIVVTLTDGSSVAIDASAGNVFRWPLGAGSHTLAAPSNPSDGQAFRLRIAYSGSFTPLFNAIYDFGADGQPSWTATNGKTDYAGFEYDAGITKWCCIGTKLGF